MQDEGGGGDIVVIGKPGKTRRQEEFLAVMFRTDSKQDSVFAVTGLIAYPPDCLDLELIPLGAISRQPG